MRTSPHTHSRQRQVPVTQPQIAPLWVLAQLPHVRQVCSLLWNIVPVVREMILAVLITCLSGLTLSHPLVPLKQGLANRFLKAQTQIFSALWACVLCHNHSALLCTVESATGQPGHGQQAEGRWEPGLFCCSECEWCEGATAPFLAFGGQPLPCPGVIF